ncbi:MAG: HlyD family type I secretion periplasmic adaptor subunit [Gammaproteobacteria bacterium]|nr:HlyD family type I secretion periplasmic adaptor subunit [Rhodocyclaceae bacterium]MBU3910948.1 HlyD family type I secretion periplasmic adaptor subunit [Gammaproteobacteria bacterium]MBU3989724.1 HlyD family type I secretion periplasmic adaptor subunit [Gammaproteobacteria bacterium]MBU4003700.1 HlyD family type I secretion periplasmic adaptor subunit [Gammaproteobacteria bacterium]MBU4098009.1 HlyD family type I secretion periplasmic adaptor subunit [Gammaproteobacteria bacterium]
MRERLFGLTAPQEDFSPPILKLQAAAPSPLPRLILRILLGLMAAILLWAVFGRLDIIAVAQGKLVPVSYLKVIQPAESGIVAELLVRGGDEVKEGQVLVRMDRHVSDADNRQIENDLALKRLTLRRIDAELTNKPMQRQKDDPPGLYGQVEAQALARRQAYQDSIDAERALLTKAEQDYQAARQQEKKLTDTAPIAREQEAGWNQLMKEGFAGKLIALDKTRSRIELEQELAAQKHAVESLKAAIEQSRKKIAQITSGYRQQLSTDRVEVEAQLHKVSQDWEKQNHRHGLLELKAPQTGFIKDMATHTRGTVVQPGTILMTLIPKDEPMQAEVWVSNLDAGFIQAGQKVKLKFVTYSFHRYGMVEGEVTHISPDATEGGDPNARRATQGNAGEPPTQPVGYRTLVALKSPYLESEGQRYRLSPGMQVAAEIHLGTRSVLEYVLSPVRKVAQEAGRER